MEDKKELILNFMNEDIYVPMKAKEMASILQVKKEDYTNFLEVLNSLEEEYKIQKNRKSKYSLIPKNKYFTGIFNANEKGFGFVKIEEKEDEIYISKNQTKNALNGDKVLIELLEDKKENNHQEGKIVKILTHNKNTLVGTFSKNKNYGFVVPDDTKFGTDVYISKKNMLNIKDNTKVLVEIIKYPQKR